MTKAELTTAIETSLKAYFVLAALPENKTQLPPWHATQMATAIAEGVHTYAIALTTTNVSSHVHAIANPG